MALHAGLLSDDRRRLSDIGQQLIGGIGHHQNIAGLEFLRHLVSAAADAQRTGGFFLPDTNGIHQSAAHLLNSDHVCGSGHAHRHAGGDYHQIALVDHTRLGRRLNSKVHQLVSAAGVGHHNRLHAPVQSHLPPDLLIQQAGDDGGAGMEAAHQPGGGSPLADGENGVRSDLLRRGAGGVGGSRRHGKSVPSAGHLGHALDMVDVALRPPGDGVHGLHGFHRISACCRLAGEHDGRGAVIDGVGHIGDLRTGGPGIFHHGIQHLCSCDDRLAAGHTPGDHILLDQGDLRKVDLHTHIAASHHDAVRRVQDLRKIADALLIFDLGDDPHPRTGLVQYVPQFPYICGGTDKAGCHIVEPLLRTEEEIVPVLLAHVGHIQPHTGDIDPLVVLHITVIFHSAADLRLAGLQNSQPHQTVVQQDGISRFDVTGQFSVGDGTAVRIALHLNGGQGKFLTGGQMDPSAGKVLQTNLRALGIQHGRHRGVQFFPQRLQRV